MLNPLLIITCLSLLVSSQASDFFIVDSQSLTDFNVDSLQHVNFHGSYEDVTIVSINSGSQLRDIIPDNRIQPIYVDFPILRSGRVTIPQDQLVVLEWQISHNSNDEWDSVSLLQWHDSVRRSLSSIPLPTSPSNTIVMNEITTPHLFSSEDLFASQDVDSSDLTLKSASSEFERAYFKPIIHYNSTRRLIISVPRVNVNLPAIISSAMPSVPLVEILSDFLPINTIYLPVPSEPLPFPDNLLAHDFAPRLPATLNALLEAYSAPTIPPINPQIVDLLDKVSITALKSDVTWLTGERSDSVLQTRHSLSDDIKVATKWIKKRFQQAGCDVELFYHRDNYAPNVICKLEGTDTESDEVMVVSAHYDDRNTFPWKYGRAPGANDDASGTSLILSLLSVLSRNSSTNSTVSLTKTLYIVAFSGEEQGLLGSKAYAAHLRKNDVNIILNIQADMVAYRKPGRELQLGFPKRYHTEEATELVKMIISQYMPSIVLGETPACCSDHQSFFEQGYPATAFFENNGPIQDPKYHNSGDIANRPGYDFEELAALTKAMIAVVGVVAGVY